MNTPTLAVRFFKTDGGTEPVRDWLRELSAIDRKTIGEDIKTVQFGWPLGMPLVRKMEKIYGKFVFIWTVVLLECCLLYQVAR